MSWTVAVTQNTLIVTKKCAKELFKVQGEDGDIWYHPDEVRDEDSCVTVNSDAQEHIDWLANNPKLVEVLKKHKVKGDICFGSVEGDNAGSFWGYRFDGLGGMKTLTGEVTYTEDADSPLKDKVFVITGTLKAMKRAEAENKIVELGGTLAKSLSSKTNYLVVGDDPGSKVNKASQYPELKQIAEEEFTDMLGM